MVIVVLGRVIAVLVALGLACGVAVAEPREVVSLELGGKGGLWGLGFEWRPRWYLVGVVGSYYPLSGDRFATLSPYAGVFPLISEHHAWFLHAGPQVVHHATPSPFPEWQGVGATGWGVEVSSGYEYRRGPVVARAYAMLSLGDHLVPWIGTGVGWSL
jgi:hypothetical protein